MSNETIKSTGSHMLTWAMIVGAAALFVEITVASMNPVPEHTATVQTVTVQPERLARN